MAEKNLSDYTEKEFYEFITKIKTADFLSESAHDEAIYNFSQLTEHPDGWDLIYYPEPNADNSTQGIINAIKKWREANGKPGFKPE